LLTEASLKTSRGVRALAYGVALDDGE
jgi:hypothetical protein